MTEAERLVVQRVGQDLFRNGLLDYWEGRCAITRLAVPQLLRASHIRPWADCTADADRLNVFNGFLRAAHLDAAFDSGFITVNDDGAILVAKSLDEGALRLLGLDRPLRVRSLADRKYLPWHVTRYFGRHLSTAASRGVLTESRLAPERLGLLTGGDGGDERGAGDGT